eukprot:m.297012 g.297012  ORF g.297012 m.297012 type:complete len:92 (+) comp55163_c0_seq46:1865-2140(+)
MDGQDSDMFKYFKFLLVRGFLAARKHHERFVVIVDIMQQESHMPCFSGRDTIKVPMTPRGVVHGFPEPLRRAHRPPCFTFFRLSKNAFRCI